MKFQHLSSEIVEMYQNGSLLKDVANKFGCSPETVARYLRNAGVEISNHKVQTKDEEILEYYSSCKSLKDTCNNFNLSHGYVRTIILTSSQNVNLRSKNWNKENDSRIVDMYKSGLSAQEIGDVFGFCHTTILRHLQRLGLIRRKTSSRKYEGVAISTFNRIKNSAKKRGLNFSITKSFIDKLFIKQEGKCALSGVNIVLPENFTELSTGFGTASLDRIDSSKGYEKGNVQWVHKTINVMKQSLSDDELIEWCSLVYNHDNS